METQAICNADTMAVRLGALAHPARLHILKHLSSRPACCCKEVVESIDLAQSTVSQHLKILVEAGLVTYRPDRPRSRYEVDREALASLSRGVAGLIDMCCANHAAATHSSQDNRIGI
jgi:ArsR family transcriptional regulator, arsenate/arsenite/antimonite-responsive transcriptional repressor